MKILPQPGAATLVASIASTCALLFLFQKIIWLVAPAALALMIYYFVRPAVESLAARGVRHETAAMFVWILLQLIAVACVATLAIRLTETQLWQPIVQRYIEGAHTLLRKTIDSLEELVPA